MMLSQQFIDDVFSVLTEEESRVLRLYFGLDTPRLTTEQIAETFPSRRIRPKGGKGRHLGQHASAHVVRKYYIEPALDKISKAGKLYILRGVIDGILKQHQEAFQNERELFDRNRRYLPNSSIDDILHDLPSHYEKVIRLRYGIGMVRCLPLKKMGAATQEFRADHCYKNERGERISIKRGHTLEEIGGIMNCGPERVRQIEAKALRMLRKKSSELVSLFSNGLYSEGLLIFARMVLKPEQYAKLRVWDPQSEPMPTSEPGRPLLTVEFRPVILMS